MLAWKILLQYLSSSARYNYYTKKFYALASIAFYFSQAPENQIAIVKLEFWNKQLNSTDAKHEIMGTLII